MAKKELKMGLFQSTEKDETMMAHTAEIKSDTVLPTADKRNLSVSYWEIAHSVDVEEDGYIRNTGVGLRESEIEIVDRYAEQIGMGRNAIIREAVRLLIQQVESGLITLTSEAVAPQTMGCSIGSIISVVFSN